MYRVAVGLRVKQIGRDHNELHRGYQDLARKFRQHQKINVGHPNALLREPRIASEQISYKIHYAW